MFNYILLTNNYKNNDKYVKNTLKNKKKMKQQINGSNLFTCEQIRTKNMKR